MKILILTLTHIPFAIAQINRIDLSTVSAFQGEEADDRSGYSARFAGDFDGDGDIDVIIGEPDASPAGLYQAGSVRLIWGPVDSSDIFYKDLASFNITDGLQFIGSREGSRIGLTVDTAGDFNKDGYADISFCEDSIDLPAKPNAGRCFLVLGRARSACIPVYDLAITPLSNFSIVSIEGKAGDNCGTSVSHANDIDRDGYDDLLIGCEDASPQGRGAAGRTYACYGRSDLDLLWVFDLDNHLFHSCRSIDGYIASGNSGGAVIGCDVNRDNYTDVITAAYEADALGLHDAGILYIYLGGPRENPLQDFDLASIHSALPGGTMINSPDIDSLSGRALACGDVDGDSIKDVIAGAYRASRNQLFESGAVYVYPGREIWPSAIDGSNVTDIIIYEGAITDARCGKSLASGDFNGDKYADLVIGCNHYNSQNGDLSGRALVIAGRERTKGAAQIIDLALKENASDTLLLDGSFGGDRAGRSVASGYDVDNDGRDDVLVGAGETNANGRSNSGSTFFVSSVRFSNQLTAFYSSTSTTIPSSTSAFVSTAADTSNTNLTPFLGTTGTPVTAPGFRLPASPSNASEPVTISSGFILALTAGLCGLLLLVLFCLLYKRHKMNGSVEQASAELPPQPPLSSLSMGVIQSGRNSSRRSSLSRQTSHSRRGSSSRQDRSDRQRSSNRSRSQSFRKEEDFAAVVNPGAIVYESPSGTPSADGPRFFTPMSTPRDRSRSRERGSYSRTSNPGGNPLAAASEYQNYTVPQLPEEARYQVAHSLAVAVNKDAAAEKQARALAQYQVSPLLAHAVNNDAVVGQRARALAHYQVSPLLAHAVNNDAVAGQRARARTEYGTPFSLAKAVNQDASALRKVNNAGYGSVQALRTEGYGITPELAAKVNKDAADSRKLDSEYDNVRDPLVI